MDLRREILLDSIAWGVALITINEAALGCTPWWQLLRRARLRRETTIHMAKISSERLRLAEHNASLAALDPMNTQQKAIIEELLEGAHGAADLRELLLHLRTATTYAEGLLALETRALERQTEICEHFAALARGDAS